MQGLPKILQTRADFDLALSMARLGRIGPSVVVLHFDGLIESAQSFVFDRILTATEAPDGAMPAFCVTEATDQDLVRRQLKLVNDQGGRLFTLGYTLAEVQLIITELGAM